MSPLGTLLTCLSVLTIALLLAEWLVHRSPRDGEE